MLRYFACCVVLTVGMLGQQPPAELGPQAGTSFQIAGVLVDALTGQPIQDARVAIAPVAKRDAMVTLITGEDGGFVFGGLPVGKYALSAQRRGYLTRSFNQHENFSSSIAVGPGFDAGNLVFRLSPECAISGRISDEAGEPVRDAQVSLYENGNVGGEHATRLRGQSITDESGLYHFAHLQPGKYFVAVSAKVWYAQRPMTQGKSTHFTDNGATFVNDPLPPGAYPEEQGSSPLDVAYPITFYPNVTDARGATPIAVRDGERFVADVMLQPVPALRLRIPAREASGGGAPRSSFLRLKASSLTHPCRSILNREPYRPETLRL